jgi:5-methylcytosine-specific restriction protein A
MAAFRCDTCGFASFKTEQSFQGHLLTKKHMMRQETVREDLFQCKTCNKWYCGRSGISHHKKTCSSKNVKNPNPMISEQQPDDLNTAQATAKSCNVQKDATTSVQEIVNELKLTFDKERQEMKQTFAETMKEEINKSLETHLDLFKKERKEMKDKIAVLEHNINNREEFIATSGSYCVTQPQPQKSREFRKKINKEVRRLVADKQQNTCGECKLLLTPYFQIDHIIGLQFGGTDDESNLMALCCECHAIKSIGENQCRKQIQNAIQTILREKRNS